MKYSYIQRKSVHSKKVYGIGTNFQQSLAEALHLAISEDTSIQLIFENNITYIRPEKVVAFLIDVNKKFKNLRNTLTGK